MIDRLQLSISTHGNCTVVEKSTCTKNQQHPVLNQTKVVDAGVLVTGCVSKGVQDKCSAVWVGIQDGACSVANIFHVSRTCNDFRTMIVAC